MCRGRRGRRPLHQHSTAAKSLRSLRILCCAGNNKSGAVLCFDIYFVKGELFVFFFFFSAPLNRLAPIEALPQAPTGLCPVPTMGFTPCPWTFCSLRSVLYFYLMLVYNFGLLCQFLIPHSSFLIPHSSLKIAVYTLHTHLHILS